MILTKFCGPTRKNLPKIFVVLVFSTLKIAIFHYLEIKSCFLHLKYNFSCLKKSVLGHRKSVHSLYHHQRYVRKVCMILCDIIYFDWRAKFRKLLHVQKYFEVFKNHKMSFSKPLFHWQWNIPRKFWHVSDTVNRVQRGILFHCLARWNGEKKCKLR